MGALAAAFAAGLAGAPAAGAQIEGLPPIPIPSTPLADDPAFTGRAASLDPIDAPAVPRHPFMAPNGLSNLHNDAYQSDAYRWPARGPRRPCSVAGAMSRSPTTPTPSACVSTSARAGPSGDDWFARSRSSSPARRPPTSR
jgi:hypothetical protein